tara:strand:+ start:9045 stop:9209 length:165 start_codon:yes stop_codon:yes gene_type:complete
LTGITVVSLYGAIAQLVEHLHGMQGVSGSSPLSSIKFFVMAGIHFTLALLKIKL